MTACCMTEGEVVVVANTITWELLVEPRAKTDVKLAIHERHERASSAHCTGCQLTRIVAR